MDIQFFISIQWWKLSIIFKICINFLSANLISTSLICEYLVTWLKDENYEFNRIYFYQTYVNQLSKNKNRNAVKAVNETSNGNGTDKRKRESTPPIPPVVMNLDGSQPNKIEEMKKEVKKIK